METFSEKKRVINEFIKKCSSDEKKLILQLIIQSDIKLYFEAMRDEQKRLEKEVGLVGVTEYEEYEKFEPDSYGQVSKEAENAYYCDEKKKNVNNKLDGFLGAVDNEKDTNY